MIDIKAPTPFHTAMNSLWLEGETSAEINVS